MEHHIFAPMSTGQLSVVATPIGNLGDITFRAVEQLRVADLILAEDTRQTKKLLDHYDIANRLQSFHQHNEHKTLGRIIDELKAGKHFALCSDAGTPGISDPGYLLIRECIRQEIDVEVLPGATAVIPAVVGSGLPSDTFVFQGFLPHKKGKQTQILALENETKTTVFYESPHRILKTLKMVNELLGEDRQVVVARELTKKFEEYIRGTALSVLEHFVAHDAKGEIVLIIGGKNG